MVADALRDRILAGDLREGDMLPRQVDLMVDYPVSAPSLREAMRILETEGLISVRRGNIGGAVVHSPNADSVAYSLGLLLQSSKVEVSDMAAALRMFEPACAAMCAGLPDRAISVVPALRQCNEESLAAVTDGPEFTRAARRFHTELVAGCGNQTVTALLKVLESLWSLNESDWAAGVVAEGRYPDKTRRRMSVRAHVGITDVIESGDVDRAAMLTRRHIEQSQTFVLAIQAGRPIKVTGLARRKP